MRINKYTFGDDDQLIHVRDERRAQVGKDIAEQLNLAMRREALADGERTLIESSQQALCPGCFMIIGFNAMVETALANGYPLSELGEVMSSAFGALAKNGDLVEQFKPATDSPIKALRAAAQANGMAW